MQYWRLINAASLMSGPVPTVSGGEWVADISFAMVEETSLNTLPGDAALQMTSFSPTVLDAEKVTPAAVEGAAVRAATSEAFCKGQVSV